MVNPFKNRIAPLNGPALDMVPVVPSDTVDLSIYGTAIYVTGAGSVSFVSIKGLIRTVSVTGFSILPVGVRRINATGTTATGIHAFLAC